MEPLPMQTLPDHPWWERGIGILFIALGALGIYYSFYSTIASVIYIGILFLSFGILQFLRSFKETSWKGLAVHMTFAVLYAFAGMFLIKEPGYNALTLTLVMAILFVLSGLSRMLLALFERVPYRALLFFSGLITFVLGVLLWQQWPVSGLWALGLFVSIDLILSGASLIMISMQKD